MKALIWQERNPGVQGGAESWVTDTAAALRLLGHQVAWLYSDQIKRALDEFKPDIVLLGTLHNFIGLEPAAWLADQRVPGIWFVHDYWPFCGPRMLMQAHNQSDRECEAVEGVCRNTCGGRRPIPEVLSRFYTVTGCEGAADIMRRHGLRVDAVIEEGIDTETFKPDLARRESPTVVYASAAWNAPWKGMHILSRALEGTGLTLKLLTGLTRLQVAAELPKASIFVMPSLYQEIWGLALTEAMACGCACIASDVAGGKAQIEDQLTGMLYERHNPKDLRYLLQWLADNPTAQREFGEAARAHVVQHHSLEAVGKRWEAAFREVLACVA